MVRSSREPDALDTVNRLADWPVTRVDTQGLAALAAARPVGASSRLDG